MKHTKASPQNVKRATPTVERQIPVRIATPGSRRLRADLVSRLRSDIDTLYKRGHLSELLLLHDALLLAESERSSTHAGDDCPLGNAIAECFGINALGPVSAPNTRRTA